MASFFDDDSDDDLSPARAGPSRVPAAPAALAPAYPAYPAPAALTAPRFGSTPGIDDDDLDLDDCPAANRAYGGAGGRMDYDLPTLDDGGGGGGDALPGPAEAEADKETDVTRLMRAWVAERSAPGILRWEEDLVDGVMWRVEQQREMVTLLLAEASTSEEEHFKLMLVQTEMERAKYLVRSYLRTRLAKIEKYAHLITLTPTMQPLLSPLELAHAQKFQALVAAHMKASVLDSLPERLGDLEEVSNDGMSMVSKPDLDQAVFIYCREDVGPRRLPSGDEADFAKGTTHLVRWGMVEPWVAQGRVELI